MQHVASAAYRLGQLMIQKHIPQVNKANKGYRLESIVGYERDVREFHHIVKHVIIWRISLHGLLHTSQNCGW